MIILKIIAGIKNIMNNTLKFSAQATRKVSDRKFHSLFTKGVLTVCCHKVTLCAVEGDVKKLTKVSAKITNKAKSMKKT
jgi:hypothetical protein